MRLFKNKFVAAGFVFVLLQYLAYTAYTGNDLTDSERRRSKSRMTEDMMGGLIEQIGVVPATAFLSLGGFVLAFVAYKRMERLSQS